MLSHVDEFIDDLLHSDTICAVTMPRLPKRWELEKANRVRFKFVMINILIERVIEIVE